MPGLEHVAAVVRHDPAQDLDRAGLRIHLQHHRVGAVGVARLRHAEDLRVLEAGGSHRAPARRARPPRPRASPARGSAARAPRTRRRSTTTSAGAASSRCAAIRRAFSQHRARGEQRRAAADRGGAAAVGAAARVHERGVAGQHLDRVGIHPELPADQAREHRDVPLPLRRGAADHGDARRPGCTRTTALSFGTVAVAST